MKTRDDTHELRPAFMIWSWSALAGALCGPAWLVMVRLVENPGLDLALNRVLVSLAIGGILGLLLSAPISLVLIRKRPWLIGVFVVPGTILGGTLIGLLFTTSIATLSVIVWYITSTLVIGRTSDVHSYGRGRCRHCGYSLAGLTSDVCPECGTRRRQS